MKITGLLVTTAFLAVISAAALLAQTLEPAQLLSKSPTVAWPTFHGDYSGKHYSTLDQINQSNISKLKMAWSSQLSPSTEGAQTGGVYKEGDPYYWGGPSFSVRIAAEPIVVNGAIYISTPNSAWALDAQTGKEIWHFFWKTSGGNPLGNRGMAMYGDWVYFETPDDYLVSLDAKTGKERWHKYISDVKAHYFSSVAPMVVGNHVLVGTGGDALDNQGLLQSFDPETGELQWTWYTTPQKPGDPGYDTWPDEYSMKHGGGMTWQPPTYDPTLNLVYVTTGNPNPVFAGQSRLGDNLFTDSLVALNSDTGKMVWYFQMTPHDTHDWDTTNTPILIDGTFRGRQRKMIAEAAANGYFFLLDRETGKDLVTAKYAEFADWALGINSKGQPIPNPEKDPTPNGILVAPGKSANVQPSTFDPQTGLLYVGTAQGYALIYLSDASPRPEGWGGIGSGQAPIGNEGSIKAIDYQTGKVRWTHPLPRNGVQGLLSTAGHLLFGNDTMGDFVAYDPKTGAPIWHERLAANPTNGPETFLIDGKQYILVAGANTLYAFTLSQ